MPLALSKIEQKLRESPIRRIAQLLAEAKGHRNFISLGAGAPGLPPPKEVVSAMISALEKDPFNSVSYGSSKGSSKLRTLISEDLKSSYNLSYSAEEIAVTTGATGGIFLALEDIVNAGDEVIIPDPTYVGYPGPTIIDRARIRRIPVKREDNYQLTPQEVQKVISKKTAAIILLSPDNPTGRILSKENLKGIAELAIEHDFWLISDEIYKDIIYNGKHIPAAKFAPENTITLCSFSKSAAIPGLRLGYIYGPENAVEGIVKFNQYNSLCPNTLAQIGAEAFYKVKKKYLNYSVRIYKYRMEKMGTCIQKYLPLCNFVKPDGAFYYFVDFSKYLSKLKLNDEQFSHLLLEKKKLAAIPGHFFGKTGGNHLRLTFVTEKTERIEEGIKRIAELCID